MHREWMQAWVLALRPEDEVYIRKQPGISEEEIQKRLVHWEWVRIQNKAKYW